MSIKSTAANEGWWYSSSFMASDAFLPCTQTPFASADTLLHPSNKFGWKEKRRIARIYIARRAMIRKVHTCTRERVALGNLFYNFSNSSFANKLVESRRSSECEVHLGWWNTHLNEDYYSTFSKITSHVCSKANGKNEIL